MPIGIVDLFKMAEALPCNINSTENHEKQESATFERDRRARWTPILIRSLGRLRTMDKSVINLMKT